MTMITWVAPVSIGARGESTLLSVFRTRKSESGSELLEKKLEGRSRVVEKLEEQFLLCFGLGSSTFSMAFFFFFFLFVCVCVLDLFFSLQ